MDIGTVRSLARSHRARARVNTRVSARCSRRARVKTWTRTFLQFGRQFLEVAALYRDAFGDTCVNTVIASSSRRVCWNIGRERSIRESNRPISYSCELLTWPLPVWVLLRGTRTEYNSLVNWKKNSTINHLFVYYDLWVVILIGANKSNHIVSE